MVIGRLHYRKSSRYFFGSGRIFQQFCADAGARIDLERINYWRNEHNQARFRVETSKG
jgi:hypothetical protein